MPCFLTILALLTPRLVVALVWLFSRWFSGVFPSPVLPLLGFIFLPTTLLWYTAVQHWFAGQWTFWPVVGIVLALLIDLSPASGRRWRRVPQP
jgi:hypothetical protein